MIFCSEVDVISIKWIKFVLSYMSWLHECNVSSFNMLGDWCYCLTIFDSWKMPTRALAASVAANVMSVCRSVPSCVNYTLHTSTAVPEATTSVHHAASVCLGQAVRVWYTCLCCSTKRCSSIICTSHLATCNNRLACLQEFFWTFLSFTLSIGHSSSNSSSCLIKSTQIKI